MKKTDSTKPTSAKAADVIVSTLEKRIYSRTLKNGEMLPTETALAEEFNVSRTVARESIKILTAKGLIEALPRHRPIVRRPGFDSVSKILDGIAKHFMIDPQGVKEVFDVRIFLEASLVRMAALKANKDHIKNLREALAYNHASINDSNRFYDSDKKFHSILYTLPENTIFPGIHRAFCDWLDEHWRQMPRLPERNAHNYRAHKAIFDAILDRDPDKAEQALNQHLNEAWTQVSSTFKDANAE